MELNFGSTAISLDLLFPEACKFVMAGADLDRPNLIRLLYPSPKMRQYVILLSMFLFLFFGLVVLVPNVWIPTLQPGGLVYSIVDIMISSDGMVTHLSLYLLLVGMFLGSAVLWFFDSYKLVQAVALWVGVVAAGLLFYFSWGGSAESGLLTGAILLVLGAVVVMQASGLPLVQRYTNFCSYTKFCTDKKRLLQSPPREFKRAVKLSSVFVVVFASAGFLHTVIAGSADLQTQILYGAATVSIIVPMYVFQKYSHEEKIIQLGPAKSGKTSVQGGLYKSVRQPIEKESPLLDKIVNDHIDKGRFPDRTRLDAAKWQQHTVGLPANQSNQESEQENTDEALLIEFSYVTRRNILFPKKRTITAIDYPGELLTGLSEAPPLSSCVRAQDPDERWEAIITDWKNESSQKDENEFMKELSKLVLDADWILFTAPMDDFLESLVHDRPDHIPPYHRRALYKIEQSGEGESAYEKTSLTGDREKETVGNTDGFLGDTKLYERDKNERSDPADYLNEYMDVIDSLDDKRNHNFLWVATMGDIVNRDFEAHFEHAVDAKIGPDDDVNKIEVSSDTIQINPDSDIDIDAVTNIFDRDNKTVTNEQYLILFSLWIQQEYINEYSSQLKPKMGETSERHFFPVWFDIVDEKETRFETETQPVLKGSQHVLGRLNGTTLKKSYQNWSTVLSSKLGIADSAAISTEMMGYEVLEAIKDSGEAVETNK